MRLSVTSVGSQKASLRKLAEMTANAIVRDPRVRVAALALVNDCPSRDDACELEAVFRAVKSGDPRVPGLEHGVRYVSDPRLADYYTAPGRVLQLCGMGSCGEDCDGQAALIAALLGTLGFVVGLRAYAPPGEEDYVHVYAVAGLPKYDPQEFVGLDPTVKQSYVGWEPPPGRVLTAWIK
jgi:hypothetical protein